MVVMLLKEQLNISGQIDEVFVGSQLELRGVHGCTTVSAVSMVGIYVACVNTLNKAVHGMSTTKNQPAAPSACCNAPALT